MEEQQDRTAKSVDEKTRKWVIYKITNPAGCVYIGRSVNYNNRLLQYNHTGTTSQQPLLYNSFVKYGKENHVFEIIDTLFGTIKDANGKEMFWIRSHMSNLCKWRYGNGLNLTDGGGGAVGFKKTPEQIARMVAFHKGKKLSDEHKAKLSEIRKGKNYKLGTQQKEETKRKISETLKGRIFSDELLAKKKAACIAACGVPIIATNIIDGSKKYFGSIMEAAVFFNVKNDALAYLVGANKTGKSYIVDKTGYTFIRNIAQ